MASATIKLYASLADYLPAGAKDNAIRIPLKAEDSTVSAALADLRVPPEKCHLVLLNGIFVPPGNRADCAIKDGDTVAVWPPVAGG